MSAYNWIDPLKFKETNLPIIIFDEDRLGMFSWAIKWHSKDVYNHVEIMVHLGKIATQGFNGYKEIPIQKRLDKRIFLKFWQFDPVDRTEIDVIRRQVEKDLAKPWWARRYDFLGVLIGQLTGVRWIQSPFGKFCSESIAANLRLIPRLRKVIPARPNPAELNQIFKTISDFKILGYFWEE